MRFSWGKIWFDRFPPCKQYDISQFWADSRSFSSRFLLTLLILYWLSTEILLVYNHTINLQTLQNLIWVFRICVYLQPLGYFCVASGGFNQFQNSCSDSIYSDLSTSFVNVFLKIGISRSLIIATFTLSSMQNYWRVS